MATRQLAKIVFKPSSIIQFNKNNNPILSRTIEEMKNKISKYNEFTTLEEESINLEKSVREAYNKCLPGGFGQG